MSTRTCSPHGCESARRWQPPTYSKYLFGQRLTVAPQSVAEVRYGALKAGWGASRLAEITRFMEPVRVLPVDVDTIERVALLRYECRQIRHALHQPSHNADLWIAAAAIRWSVPLLAHDAIFIDCPGLALRTELAT